MPRLQHAQTCAGRAVTWQRIGLSPAGTHHVRDGAPLYTARFDEVLDFREPGLAPARRGERAWHIRTDGAPAYRRRFRRTFGFYEGLAAAAGPDGWRHIRPGGADLYPARFDWCGNFREGRCAVREFDGNYLHVTPEGKPAYDARWRYAGDFHDGMAVAQSGDGRSTHIDSRGQPIHGVRFLDLDVFHKGYARARDEGGWTHIDATGRPLYARRFAMVEPFYNGQARAERFNGGLEVIDAAGCTLVELRPSQRSEFAALSDDLTGFWRTQAICAAVELGAFEALPATAETIARACDLDWSRARRLLRALSELHLTEETDGEWRVTERGTYLKAGHFWTLAGAAREYGRVFSRTWEALPGILRGAGRSPPDIFAEVAADSDRVAIHHRMLVSYALHDYAQAPAAFGLRGDEHVIDAGGGLGALAELLVNEYPKLRVTVLDRPEVVERMARRALGDRVKARPTDLFGSWGVEGDVVVMARVLHDWDDPRALRLLRAARRALPVGGRLFIVEMVVPENGAAGSLCDLHLLAVTGGKERTAGEYAALFGESGFDAVGVRRIPAVPSIIEGRAR